MCSYMAKGVSRYIRRNSYAFESNADSWEVLCKSSRRRVDMV